MKKRFLAISITIIVIAGLAIAVNANQEPIKDYFYKFGLVDKANKEKIDKTGIYAQGKTITIFYNEVNTIVDRGRLSDADYPEKKAYDFLKKESVLFKEAVKNNFTASDEDIKAKTKENKESFEQSQDYNKFLTYLNGLGCTVDEYWEDQYEPIKKDLSIGEYLKDIKTKFEKDNANLSQEDAKEKWDKYYLDLYTKLIKEENFKMK